MGALSTFSASKLHTSARVVSLARRIELQREFEPIPVLAGEWYAMPDGAWQSERVRRMLV